MRKIYRITFLLVLLVCASADVFAQQPTELEKGIALYQKADFKGAEKVLKQ